MNIRQRIREYLQKAYPYLWVNKTFQTFLNIWFDKEGDSIDLFEFFIDLQTQANDPTEVLDIVRENSYNPTATYEENVKAVSNRDYRETALDSAMSALKGDYSGAAKVHLSAMGLKPGDPGYDEQYRELFNMYADFYETYWSREKEAPDETTEGLWESHEGDEVDEWDE